MGKANWIDFSRTGGFPLTQNILDILQENTNNKTKAMGRALGQYLILEGCNVVGTNVAPGYVAINGNIYEFTGGILGPGLETVITTVAQENLTFEDGVQYPVLYKLTASIGAGMGTPFSSFVRVDIAGIVRRVTTLETSVSNLVTAFNTHTHSYIDITDKPILFQGTVYIGDVATDKVVNVSIQGQIVGPYTVLGSLRYSGANPIQQNDVMFTITNQTATDFQISLREVSNDIQNLYFDYVIVRG
jgi:hypothetical protein